MSESLPESAAEQAGATGEQGAARAAVAGTDRCPRCDRAECDRREASDAYAEVYTRVSKLAVTEATREEVSDALARCDAADAACRRVKIDWRLRCLRAEEEIGRLRVAAGQMGSLLVVEGIADRDEAEDHASDLGYLAEFKAAWMPDAPEEETP